MPIFKKDVRFPDSPACHKDGRRKSDFEGMYPGRDGSTSSFNWDAKFIHGTRLTEFILEVGTSYFRGEWYWRLC